LAIALDAPGSASRRRISGYELLPNNKAAFPAARAVEEPP
jgi:hypothetical protein